MTIERPMVTPGEIVKASCWWDVERAIPKDQFRDLNAHYTALVEERKAAHAAITAGTEKDAYTDDVYDAAWEAKDEFAGTVPTTLPGLLAMLTYAEQLCEKDPDTFTDDPAFIISALATAAKALIGRAGERRPA